MSRSIIPQLVRKDFKLMRGVIFTFALISLSSIGLLAFLFGKVPEWVLINIAFVMLMGPAATCGIVMLMKTNVFEKEKSTQPFILSLPVSAKQFTQAKMLINLPVFLGFWLVVAFAVFYFAFGRGLFAPGAVPFVTILFLGVFVAYSCILSTSLLSQSLAITVLSIAIFEMGTSAYLWTVVYLDPIARHINGPVMVWNTTALAIVGTQITVAVLALLFTLHMQSRKRDFI